MPIPWEPGDPRCFMGEKGNVMSEGNIMLGHTESLDLMEARRSGNTAPFFDYDVITSNTIPEDCYTEANSRGPSPQEVIDALATIADHAIPDKRIDYKYAEDQIIADFLNYIDKTYGQHYKTANQKIECFDAWLAMGDATPTFRNTAIKYLWRYGKKKTYAESKEDLFKALHYVLMCLYNDHYRKK